MNDNKQTKSDSLKALILQKIESNEITPDSKAWWLLREYILWLLWGISVAVGSLAIALIIYNTIYASYSAHEITHPTLMVFIIDILPVLWLCVLLLMALLAYINVRYTRRGYRYSYLFILGSSIALSVFGGGLLYTSGWAQTLDYSLGERMPMYSSVIKKDRGMWHQPAAGRLLGTVTFVEGQYTLTDRASTSWQINLSHFASTTHLRLTKSPLVQLLGHLDEQTKSFLVCHIMLLDKKTMHKPLSLQKNRKDMIRTLEKEEAEPIAHSSTSRSYISADRKTCRTTVRKRL